MRHWILLLLLLPVLIACQTEVPSATGFLGGDFAFIPYEERVQIVDIADESQPRFVTEFALPGYVIRVVANGRYLYVIHSSYAPSWESENGPPDAGLQIVDVGDPTQPQMLGHVYPQSIPTDLLLHGDLLYLATEQFIDVIDVSNREAPRELGTFSEGATSLARDGQRLAAGWGGCYFRTGYCEGGVRLFDLSEAERPFQIGELQFDEKPGYGVALADDYAFVTGKGMSVIDLSDLAALQINGRYPLEDSWYFASKILLDGNLAYTLQPDGLQIIDISQPTEPQWIGAYPTMNPLTDLVLRNGRLYLTGWSELLIMDIADPTFPNLLGSYTIIAPTPPVPQPTTTP